MAVKSPLSLVRLTPVPIDTDPPYVCRLYDVDILPLFHRFYKRCNGADICVLLPEPMLNRGLCTYLYTYTCAVGLNCLINWCEGRQVVD